jgi:hypothetical protein
MLNEFFLSVVIWIVFPYLSLSFYSIKAGLISNWTSFVMLLFLFFAMDHFYSAIKKKCQ